MGQSKSFLTMVWRVIHVCKEGDLQQGKVSNSVMWSDCFMLIIM